MVKSVPVLAPANLFDPRGRCSRKGLLLISGLLLAVEIALALLWLATGADFGGAPALIIKSVLLWLAFAATSKRLHDCGLSAWWFVGGLFGVMAWSFLLTTGLVIAFGAAALAVEGGGFTAAFAGTCLPAMGLLIWLHCQAGERGLNRFGPEPDASGFSPPADLAGTAVRGASLATPA